MMESSVSLLVPGWTMGCLLRMFTSQKRLQVTLLECNLTTSFMKYKHYYYKASVSGDIAKYRG